MEGNIIYVGNLYLRATKEQLKLLCSKYGEVKNIDFIPGSGYAFVKMSNPEEAERAVSALDGSEFLERVLKVKTRPV
ncbi:MAG: RNA-binding protein [Candidatus Aminicenantales bacterium]